MDRIHSRPPKRDPSSEEQPWLSFSRPCTGHSQVWCCAGCWGYKDGKRLGLCSEGALVEMSTQLAIAVQHERCREGLSRRCYGNSPRPGDGMAGNL